MTVEEALAEHETIKKYKTVSLHSSNLGLDYKSSLRKWIL